jgi:hypothetical protein
VLAAAAKACSVASTKLAFWLDTLPAFAIRVYVPAAAAGCPDGHPCLDLIRSQTIVTVTGSSGCSVRSLDASATAQSSELQIRVVPDSAVASQPRGPTSYRHGPAPTLTMLSRNVASWVGGNVLLVGLTDTLMLASWRTRARPRRHDAG